MWALYFMGVTWTVLSTLGVPILREGQPCTTPNQTKGECIPLKKCASLVKIIQRTPLFEDDVRFLRASECGFDNESLVSLEGINCIITMFDLYEVSI